jgi:hypothetical protein
MDPELQDASARAANWAARAISLSWGFDTSLMLRANDRFYDDMVLNRFRAVVKSAGNRGCATPGDEGSAAAPAAASPPAPAWPTT